MRAKASTAQLLAATAIYLTASIPAHADANGVTSTDSTPISNPSGSTIQGDRKGIYSTGPSLTLTNDGVIRGNGLSGGVNNSDGGVVISGGPASISNSGTISGARFGISTQYFTNTDSSTVGLAIGSTIDNSGTIIGDSDDGIRLIGGGSVTNSGYIAGRVGAGADGISIFAYNGQDTSGITSLGSVINLPGGVIEGNRYGVIIFGPGSIDNAGTINGTTSIQGSFLFAPGQAQVGTITNSGIINGYGIVLGSLDSASVDNSGYTGTIGFAGVGNATVNNSGRVNYFTSFNTVGTATVNNSGSIGEGLIFTKTGTANVTNSGSIRATNTTDVVGTTQDAVYSEAALTLTNMDTGSINGFRSGIRSNGPSLIVDNAGTIRGNGTTFTLRAADAGILVLGGPATITNSGSISGAGFGITTGVYSDPNTNAASGRAVGSTVVNSGSIIGDSNDGVRLIGGGTVTNSGYIAGRVGAGADGVSMFAFEDQDTTAMPQIGTVNNLAGGIIEGNRFGIILSGGGTVSNAGTINGGYAGGVLIQTGFIGGKTGAVLNGGTINGTVQFNSLASASVDNSGAITSLINPGVFTTAPSGSLTVNNQATGSITGATSGIRSEGSSLSVTNAGTIRGNGTTFTLRAADAGILVLGGPATITNSGSISGAGFGITTGVYSDPDTNAASGRAVGSTVVNSGSIIGDSNDGVRLIGGGTVTNSGYIAGRVGAGADGVSMFAFEDQDTTAMPQIGTVNNLLGGVIEGFRFGIIQSGGGTINNAGTINGGTNGAILIQTGFIDGKTGTINNSGTINGTTSFVDLATASVTNSGSMTGTKAALFADLQTGPVSVSNSATGTMTGGTSGIHSQASSLSVTNAGTIRGNGSYDGFDAPPDAGIDVSGGPANIQNTGTISGQRFGITTSYLFNPNTSLFEGRAIGSTVSNSGSIIGDTDIGIRLIGGGTVTNSGYIAGRVGPSADGVWMMAYNDQPLGSFANIGTVNNLAGGIIEGNRRGVTLANGGTVNNAGTISGNAASIRIVALANDTGRTGTVVNSGTLNGKVELIGLTSASVSNSGTTTGGVSFATDTSSSLVNSGTIDSGPAYDAVFGDGPLSINNAAAGSIIGSGNGVNATGPSLTLVNSGVIRGSGNAGINLNAGSISNLAGGLINGGTLGIYFVNGAGSVSNAGTISTTNGDAAVAFNSMAATAPSTVTNSGTISGSVQFGSNQSATLTNSGSITARGSGLAVWSITPTTLTNSGSISTAGPTAVQLSDSNDTVILNTGSSITGAVDGRGGSDTLRLSGTVGTPTALQSIGHFDNFETLNVLGGYWTTSGNTGTFTSTTLNGGALAVNGTLTSPITVNGGAMLAGIGTITGASTVNSGGMIAPGGSSIGTLNITGNVLFNAGSTFSIQTNPNGTSDRLAVIGGVTINRGATLQVLAGIANYAPTTSYVVLTASGGINGKFDTVVTDYAYFKATVNTQQKGTITVQIAPNGKPLPSAATATTFSAATAVDALGAGNGIYQAVLFQSLTGARQAFSSLSGGGYGRLDQLMASDFGHMQLGLSDARGSAPNMEWAGANAFSDAGIHGGSVSRVGPVSLLMVGGAYSSRFSSNEVNSDTETRFFGSGISYRSGRFEALAGATAAWHQVNAGRTISFPGFRDWAVSRYSAQTHRIDVEGAYSLSRGKVALAPYAAYSKIMISTPAFSEWGGPSALTFDRQTRTIDELKLGISMRGNFTLKSARLSPHFDLSVQRAWGDLAGIRNARFLNGAKDFDSVGSGFNARTASVDAGLDFTAGAITISGSYRGQLGDAWSEHSGILKAALHF